MAMLLTKFSSSAPLLLIKTTILCQPFLGYNRGTCFHDISFSCSANKWNMKIEVLLLLDSALCFSQVTQKLLRLSLGSSYCTIEGALIPVYTHTEICQAGFKLQRTALQEFINTGAPCARSLGKCNRKPKANDPREMHRNLPALL